MRSSFRWRRVAALPLFVALIAVSGCQQADLPPWAGGTKPPASAPAPARPQVQAPPPVVVPVPPPVDVQPLPSAFPRAIDKDQVRAALLVPLSGQYASWGNALSNAAQLAMFEVGDDRFNLIPVDTRGTAEGAQAAIRLALAQGADIVLGPLFSHEVKAAAGTAREQSVPMLAFTTDRSAVGTGVYGLGIMPNPQVNRVVAHARASGFERIALLAPANEYGQAVAEALKAAVLANGARLAKMEFYDPNAQDHSALVKRFTEYDARIAHRPKDSAEPAAPPPFDALLLPDSGTRLRGMAALVTYYEVDPAQVKFMGTLLWDDPALASEAALEGGWYAAPPTTDHTAFQTRYTKAFGALPSAQVGSLASIAYDATALAAQLARQGFGHYPADQLTNPNGFAGVDGIFRLLPDGTSERGLEVRAVARGRPRVISAAPETFVLPPGQ